MTVDKSKDRVRGMFAAIARRYDLLNHLLSLGVDWYWRWRTTRLVPPAGMDPILDVCTGTGDLALAYSRARPDGVNVVGADFCRPMLKLAVTKAGAIGLQDRTQFVEADAQALPFADNTFQIACVAFGLRNVSDTMAGLSEMVRVVRPGGRVAVLEFSLPARPLLRGFYSLYFRFLLPVVGQTIAPNPQRAYNYLPASVLEFPEGEHMLALMRRCGLVETRWHRLTFGIASLYVGTKPAGEP